MNDLAQAGILNRPPDHLLAAALTLKTTDAPSTSAAIEALRAVVQQELTSALPPTTPATPKNAPSPETGELGFDNGFERYGLTITIGIGPRVFDLLGTATDNRPQDLEPIPWSALGDSPVIGDNGDVLLQICSNSNYVNEHVVHRIQYELAQYDLTWIVQGTQRHNTRAGNTSRREGRALIGFLDGSSNLDPRCSDADAKLVFVNPDDVPGYPQNPSPQPGPGPNPYGGNQPPEFPPDLRTPPSHEPPWTKGGSYVVLRASVIDFGRWDPTNLGDQEHVVGRFKVSGQPLSATDDPNTPLSDPQFSDADGTITPLTAHIRKANPPGPGDDQRRLFRRGYPLIVAAPPEELRRGLVFIAYGRSISTQFEFITRAWTTNPNFPVPGTGPDALRTFESVLCGGYFFVPPLSDPCQPWSWALPS